MLLSATMFWLMIAVVLVVAELMTGTLYLLFLALGGVVGAGVAQMGASLEWQYTFAGGAALVGVLAAHRIRRRRAQGAPGAAVSLDIGSPVEVHTWTRRQAQVRHRGTEWQAEYVGEGDPQPGVFRIVDAQGNVLKLAST